MNKQTKPKQNPQKSKNKKTPPGSGAIEFQS
jgi:hypothetical protein